MSMIQRSRRRIFSIAAMLAVALLAPLTVNAEDQGPALAPIAGAAAQDSSGYATVEANRVLAAHQAWLSGELGSMPEERVLAVAAASPSWDATSGYASVEASRVATTSHGVLTDDAPWDTSSGYGALETSRAAAVLPPEVAPMWDETSGYGSVEVSRADR